MQHTGLAVRPYLASSDRDWYAISQYFNSTGDGLCHIRMHGGRMDACMHACMHASNGVDQRMMGSLCSAVVSIYKYETRSKVVLPYLSLQLVNIWMSYAIQESVHSISAVVRCLLVRLKEELVLTRIVGKQRSCQILRFRNYYDLLGPFSL